eukprot:COSAG01_NODE_1130_length_11575_cov_6.349773_9_plen_97_part_00
MSGIVNRLTKRWLWLAVAPFSGGKYSYTISWMKRGCHIYAHELSLRFDAQQCHYSCRAGEDAQGLLRAIMASCRSQKSSGDHHECLVRAHDAHNLK